MEKFIPGDNVHFKRTVVNKNAERSFSMILLLGHFLATLCFCIVFVTKGRRAFDKYDTLTNCFIAHRNEIRATMDDIVSMIKMVERTSRRDAPEISPAELVGGRRIGRSRRKKGKKKISVRRRHKTFKGGAPINKMGITALIVCLVAIFFYMDLNVESPLGIKEGAINLESPLGIKEGTVKLERKLTLKGEYRSFEETHERINKEGSVNAVFLDVHTHGTNDVRDQKFYHQFFKQNGVSKFRPHVSEQIIFGTLSNKYVSALYSGFYNYWINSDRIDNYQFSNGIDPSIEMLEEYLNSVMHTSLQKKMISSLDDFIKTEMSQFSIPSNSRKKRMLLSFYKNLRAQTLKLKSDEETDPVLTEIMKDRDKYLKFVHAEGDEEKLRVTVNLLCNEADKLGISVDQFKEMTSITDITAIKSKYCKPAPPPRDFERLTRNQIQYYEDALSKKIPQGYGEQMFEKYYSIPVYKRNTRDIEDGLGINLMLTTNLSGEQKQKLLEITKLNDGSNYMYLEDADGIYNDIERKDENTVNVDRMFFAGMAKDAYKKIMIDPTRIPGNVILQDNDDVTVYSIQLSKLVTLLKTYGIDNIFIHEFACDGFRNENFEPDGDQIHLRTIKSRSANPSGGKSRKREKDFARANSRWKSPQGVQY
jgi:hypothetical protein